MLTVCHPPLQRAPGSSTDRQQGPRKHTIGAVPSTCAQRRRNELVLCQVQASPNRLVPLRLLSAKRPLRSNENRDPRGTFQQLRRSPSPLLATSLCLNGQASNSLRPTVKTRAKARDSTHTHVSRIEASPSVKKGPHPCLRIPEGQVIHCNLCCHSRHPSLDFYQQAATDTG